MNRELLSYEQEFYAKRKNSSDKWEHYFEIYDDLLGKYYGTAVTYVEIGVQRGGGLEIARKLFAPESYIVGLDIDPRCKNLKAPHLADEVVIGDQTDPSTLSRVVSLTKGSIDILVDDGSHVQSHMIKSFLELFPFIKDGGVYIIEDTHTNWSPAHQESFFGIGLYDYFRGISERLNLSFIDPQSRQAFKVARENRQGLHSHYVDPFLKEIYRISFFNSIIAIEKRATKVPLRIRN